MKGGGEDGRLRWLCRRGMLELDAWLTGFLDTDYAALPATEQAAFARLLEEDDLQLFDWLTGRGVPPEDLRAVVERMRVEEG